MINAIKYLLLAIEHCVRLVGEACKVLLTCALAFVVFASFFIIVFEYGEGWNDISNSELLLMLLLGLTLWRWFVRGAQAGHGLFSLLGILVKSMAFYGAFIIVCFFAVLDWKPALADQLSSYGPEFVHGELLTLLGFIVTLWLATPLPKLASIFNQATDSDSDPKTQGDTHKDEYAHARPVAESTTTEA